MLPLLVYDTEIIKGILGKNQQPLPDIEYCDGWRDFANMGISVICAYDYADTSYRVFLADNFQDFQKLADERLVVGFNSQAFDDPLCAANDLAAHSWDLLAEMWQADNLSREFSYPSHLGYGLDATAECNGVKRKSGNGALAPILWQQGQHGRVIDYCLNDVKILKDLLDIVLAQGQLMNPTGGNRLHIERP